MILSPHGRTASVFPTREPRLSGNCTVRGQFFGIWFGGDMQLATDLTTEDLLHVSTKYLDLHSDPILHMDTSLLTVLTTHYNLYAGALAMFAPGRPDIQAALDKALRFEEL